MKHRLRYRGAPHTANGSLLHDDPKISSGPGRALCSCGWLSEDLPNGAARRRAHEAHEVAASAPSEPDPNEEVTEILRYTGWPGLFWTVLGTRAMSHAHGTPGISGVSASTATRDITLTGSREAVQRVIKEISSFWRRADDVLAHNVDLDTYGKTAVLRAWIRQAGESK